MSEKNVTSACLSVPSGTVSETTETEGGSARKSSGFSGVSGRAGPLGGLRVVDLGQYIAGPLAATLLGDQGAEILRIDPPSGPRFDSPANAYLLRGRQNLRLDLHGPNDVETARGIISEADVVIENFRPGVTERLGIGPEWCGANTPEVVYCSLPGFGSDDSRRALRGWEGVVMAAAGAYSLAVAGDLIPTGEPSKGGAVFSPLPLASVFAATEAALGITASLIARDRDGVGQWIEVPLFDSLFEAIGLRGLTFERNTKGFGDFGSGFYHCSDGRYFTFIAVWFRHLEWFVERVGLERWIEDGVVDYDRLLAEPAVLAELIRRLAALFATQPAEHWEDLARSAGCSVGMLRSAREWAGTDQAVVSATLIDVDDPDLGRVRLPGSAIRLHEQKTPYEREAATDLDPRSPPLSGIKVLDLSRVVAAPTAAKLLGQLGADVIKIDQDPASVKTAFSLPAFHEHLNRGKKSMILDLKDESGSEFFARLASRSDVLVHNLGLEAEPRLGISPEQIWKLSPGVVFVYLNTYGRSGPWAHHRGFAEIANITTGVTERSISGNMPESGASASMDFPRWTFTDYAAGVLGAFGASVGLYARARSGNGCLIETSLARATSLEQLIYMIHPVEADGTVGAALEHEKEPRGTGAKGWSPMQRLYSTKDGAIFLGAKSSDEEAVYAALGIEPDSVEEMESALAKLTSGEAEILLEPAGATVHPVTSLNELMAPGGAADVRGLRLVDSTEEYGTVVMPGPVIRFSRTPMVPGAFPTPFGADAKEIEKRTRGSMR